MKRIYSLDALRGFSLLGIVLMNVVGFTHDIFHLDPFVMFQHGWNRVLYALDVLFIKQSFYPIFALLFGYGLSMMKESADKRGEAFLPIVYRRLLALLVFGMLHGMFIFSGDILQSYAIVMLIGVPFLFWDKMISMLASIVLFGFYILNSIIPFVINGLSMPRYDYMINAPRKAEQVMEVFRSGDITAIIALNKEHFFNYFFITDVENLLFRLSSLLPLILIGSYARRAGWFEVIAHDRRFNGIGLLMFISGMMLKALPLIFYARYSADAVGGYIGGVIVAASYVICIIRMSKHPQFRVITEPISQLGRMSFTIYILQSVLMFILTYGFRLYGQMNLLETFSMACLIYALLLVFVHVYFKRFKQGPLEWIWRKITYLK
ncbi:DUF418 domain-containing protein [Macrococcus brunensis]|uniref:DUF418 domain-containing protein n=1 Tax=Macrococcus brunensis TaxID=198483 RepID=UPI001EF0F51A|nr:DUF418 domain-containing protein [Macrococcus brunensis]ULG72428.1 DUF418 domain-containing protein [Macrococcus brunensis]